MVSFIDDGNCSTLRTSTTYHKSLTELLHAEATYTTVIVFGFTRPGLNSNLLYLRRVHRSLHHAWFTVLEACSPIITPCMIHCTWGVFTDHYTMHDSPYLRRVHWSLHHAWFTVLEACSPIITPCMIHRTRGELTNHYTMIQSLQLGIKLTNLSSERHCYHR